MHDKIKYSIIIAVVAVGVLMLMNMQSEGFSTKREKAETIFGWFKSQSNPMYTDYKRDLNGGSNIVEYEDVLKLYQNRDLTVESVEKVI